MKSRYFTATLKLVIVGALSLSLAACNKGNSFQRPANAVPGNNGLPAISANGSYVRGSGSQTFQCNVNAPANSVSSPYYMQGPCFDQNLYAQAQANGTLPAGTNTGNTQNPNQPQTGQQPQVGANGQPVNPSQAPNGNPPNVSIDITPEGKIVKRNFRLVGGIGQEAVTDNCHYLKLDLDDLHEDAKNPDLNTKNVSRFLYPQYDRFEMFFDEQGNLSIAAQSINGQAYSIRSNPIPYTLNPADQSIEVGAFSIAGPASTQFIANEKAAGQLFGTSEAQAEKAIYDVQGGTNPGGSASGGSQNSPSPGFVLGPQATTNNPNGGYRSLPMNPIIETPATTALSIEGFTGKISTWAIQPQHITEILVAEIPFQSKTYVTAKPDVCQGNGHGRYVEMHLQPTQ